VYHLESYTVKDTGRAVNPDAFKAGLGAVPRGSTIGLWLSRRSQLAYMAAIPFHDFCSKVVGLKLTTGQSVLAKCVFGNYQPSDLEGRERAVAQEMFGGVLTVPTAARRIIVLRLGRGSGKTTVSAAFSIYTAVTASLHECGPGDVPVVVVVAPDKETAKLSIRMCREMARGNQALNNLIESADDTKILFRRPDGRQVAIEAFAASRGGASVRGRSILAFLLDEAEFFRSDDAGSYAVNDRDIYGAIIPRLMESGKGIFLSTPWPVETLMAELFEANYGHPVTATAVKATTLQMRPEKRALIEAELARDKDNAEREFNCEVEYMRDGGFFDTAALTGSIDTVSQFPIPRNPLWPCAAGADFAFKSDSSALVIVQWDGKYYRTSYMKELRPRKNQPLKPSEVVKEFAEHCKIYGVSGVVADGHYREALREHLSGYGLSILDAPEGTRGKMDTYTRTKGVLHEGLCRMPDSKEGRRLLEQAKTVVAKPAAGGTLSIKTPRRTGLAHGDLVSAWVLAVHHLAYGSVGKEKDIKPEYGSSEWFTWVQAKTMTAEAKREAEYLRQVERDVRKSMGKGRGRLR
jgi:hypothetical protein